MKFYPKRMLASAISAVLILSSAAYATDEVKHKLVEIKAVKDKNVSVWVQEDGKNQTVELDSSELQDKALLAEKLAYLDEDTRQTVMKALQGINMDNGAMEINSDKVFIMNKGDGQSVHTFNTDDKNFEIIVESDNSGHRRLHKQILIDDISGKEILRGHADAITKLIERGEFSRDELDKIQAALDAKR